MEPTGVLGAIGFSIAQISTILITLPQLHHMKKRYKDCRSHLQDHILSLEKSHSKFQQWEIVWHRFDTTAYRMIWAEKLADIQRARQRILELSLGIKKKIQRIKKAVSLKSEEELSTWRRVLFALSTSVTIEKDVEKLKTAIENITEICQGEFSKRIGNIRTTALTLEDTEKLYRLLAFFSPFTQRAKTLYEARRTGQISKDTHCWTVELGKHDRNENIKEWEYWDPVVVRFAFNAFPTGLNGDTMSLCVEHNRDLHDETGPRDSLEVDWQHVVCGNGNPTQGLSKEKWPITQPCRTFGRLFRDGIFEDEATLMSWKPHRAQLILSLTNWVFLLWDTPWTNSLCSLGLRTVCDAPGQASNHDLSVRLNTLGTEFKHRTDCNHSYDNKLLSFGILLAELLTTTSIRQVPKTEVDTPIAYQKWSREKNNWERISAIQLVRLVHDKSGSANMRDVVKYCIDDASVRTPKFEAGYILEYITKLYEPIEKWCKDELSADEDLNLENWTNAALENPTQNGGPHGSRSSKVAHHMTSPISASSSSS